MKIHNSLTTYIWLDYKNEGKTNTGLLGLSQFTFHPHLYIHTYICSCTYTHR